MLSVVIPVYNEEEVLPELLSRLSIASRDWGNYEIIFVDDGSVDNTPVILGEAVKKDTHLRLLSFSRNFGHQAAVTAGLEHSTGEAVVVMDGDLQDPPELIASFVEKWKAGFSVVYAIREVMKENVIKR